MNNTSNVYGSNTGPQYPVSTGPIDFKQQHAEDLSQPAVAKLMSKCNDVESKLKGNNWGKKIAAFFGGTAFVGGGAVAGGAAGAAVVGGTGAAAGGAMTVAGYIAAGIGLTAATGGWFAVAAIGALMLYGLAKVVQSQRKEWAKEDAAVLLQEVKGKQVAVNDRLIGIDRELRFQAACHVLYQQHGNQPEYGQSVAVVRDVLVNGHQMNSYTDAEVAALQVANNVDVNYLNSQIHHEDNAQLLSEYNQLRSLQQTLGNVANSLESKSKLTPEQRAEGKNDYSKGYGRTDTKLIHAEKKLADKKAERDAVFSQQTKVNIGSPDFITLGKEHQKLEAEVDQLQAEYDGLIAKRQAKYGNKQIWP